jgi:predicted nucleotidyltransferase/DNA-binding XRE family transcriptional regulator
MTPVAVLIRRARANAGLSQADLAERAGTSQPALARYETGTTIPTLPTLERLLSACGRQLQLRAVRTTEPPSPSTSVRGQLGPQAQNLRRNRRRLHDAARGRGVRKLRVFGSLARGEETPTSDVDLLVNLEPDRTLLDLAAFRREAQEILGMPVDVATPDMLKQRIRVQVESEAVPL